MSIEVPAAKADQAFFSDVTDDSIQQANTLLDYLVNNNLIPDWQQLLIDLLTPSEYQLNLHNVQAALELSGQEKPLGAVKGGTGSIKSAAGLSGEDSQRAIRLLKKSGRLIQAGKGRGKALVLLSGEHLSMDSFTARAVGAVGGAQGEFPSVPADDIPGLLRVIRESFKDLTSSYEAMKATVAEKEARIEALSKELQAVHVELERTKAAQAVATWS